MSLAQQKQIDLLKKEIKELRELVLNRDEELLKKVMYKAMTIYLDKKVEFEMSTEGQIKELMKHG